MKRFLLNTAHFTCYLVAANILCFLANKAFYYDVYTGFNPNFETYLVADSHGHSLDTLPQQYGIYNFSDPSDSYEDMLRKVKYIIANSEVKKILISADDHTLTTYREKNNNLDRSAVYATSEDYQSAYQYFSERYLKRYIPLVHGKSRDALLMNIKLLWSNTSNKKTLWADATDAYRRSRASIRSKIHYGDSERSEKMEEFLEEIIKVCQSNNVEIQGIKFPLSPEYLQAVECKGFATEEVFEKYGVEVLDFRNSLSLPQDFRDQDHVSVRGGLKFLPMLKKAMDP